MIEIDLTGCVEFAPGYWVSRNGEVYSSTSGLLKRVKCHYTNGYLVVKVYCHGEKPRNVTVHRAVAEAFICNPRNSKMVSHLDGDIRNNRASNLAWGRVPRLDMHPIEMTVRDLALSGYDRAYISYYTGLKYDCAVMNAYGRR
jgi:hypothetical protein